MAEIGHGYGSEWHLLRFLGRHRANLGAAIQRLIGCDTISWLDFPFDPKAGYVLLPERAPWLQDFQA